MLDQIARAPVSAVAEDLDVFGARLVLRNDPATDGIMIADHIVPPGYMVPPHIHADDDEYFLIAEGTLTLLGPDGERSAGAGDVVVLPRGGLHGFRNDSGAAVRFTVICKPGLQAAEMFRHFDRAGRATPGGLTPPAIMAICAQYGVRMG